MQFTCGALTYQSASSNFNTVRYGYMSVEKEIFLHFIDFNSDFVTIVILLGLAINSWKLFK